MTQLASVRALTAPIGDLGGRWMLAPEVLTPAKAAGYRHGYLYYMVGRGGVLGDVEPAVVTSAFGFFAPAIITKMWAEAVAVEGARAAAARYGAACAQYGRVRLAGFGGSPRLAELAERAADGVDVSGLSLFAGWQAEPRPRDPDGRAAFMLHVLRELRGSVHLLAVLACGLSPLQAVLATGGEENARRFGWVPPFPVVTAADKQPAEELTDQWLTRLYASVLSADETDELVSLVFAAVAHVGER